MTWRKSDVFLSFSKSDHALDPTDVMINADAKQKSHLCWLTYVESYESWTPTSIKKKHMKEHISKVLSSLKAMWFFSPWSSQLHWEFFTNGSVRSELWLAARRPERQRLWYVTPMTILGIFWGIEGHGRWWIMSCHVYDIIWYSMMSYDIIWCIRMMYT